MTTDPKTSWELAVGIVGPGAIARHHVAAIRAAPAASGLPP
ncbi:hypothetical protein [Phytoactinopolyspora limicola]|nr:hypothetical protein [Phytoactinopolyspora limicola]